MNFKSLRQALGMALSVAFLALMSFFAVSSPSLAASLEVKMGSDAGQLVFSPNQITASPGDTIDFVMNQLGPHNVVFDDAGLKSAVSSDQLMFASGEKASLTIPAGTAPGTYDFYCTPHRGAGMVGKLTVQ